MKSLFGTSILSDKYISRSGWQWRHDFCLFYFPWPLTLFDLFCLSCFLHLFYLHLYCIFKKQRNNSGPVDPFENPTRHADSTAEQNGKQTTSFWNWITALLANHSSTVNRFTDLCTNSFHTRILLSIRYSSDSILFPRPDLSLNSVGTYPITSLCWCYVVSHISPLKQCAGRLFW